MKDKQDKKVQMIMKKLLPVLLFLLLFATPAMALNKGPYLQSPGSEGVVVCFETAQPGAATVEVGLDTGYGETFTGPGVAFTHDGTTVYQYKIAVTGRAPGTLYHYRVLHGAEVTPDYTFRTAPAELEPFRFVVFGDSRGGSIISPNPNHEAVIDAIVTENPEFYFNTGDMVSAGANLDDWAYMFVAGSELLPFVPYFPVFGNHEDDMEGGLSGDRNWRRYFAVPGGDQHPTWYSFDWVNVHFVVIDIEKELTLALPGMQQNEWLRQDLEAAAANPKINFIFAFLHQPPFSFKDGRTGNPLTLLVLQPLFEQYGVEAVFEGHDHFYAHKVIGEIDHYVTGGGGASLYDFRVWPPPENAPGYRAHDQSYHYMVIEVQPETATLRAFRLDGTLIDETIIEREPPIWPTDDDTVDDDAADDDAVDDDAADDDAADDDAVDDDQLDDDVSDDDLADDDQAPAEDEEEEDDGCGC